METPSGSGTLAFRNKRSISKNRAGLDESANPAHSITTERIGRAGRYLVQQLDLAALAVALPLSQQLDLALALALLPPSQQHVHSSLQQSPQASPLHLVSQVQSQLHSSPQQALQSGQQQSVPLTTYPAGKGIRANDVAATPATNTHAIKIDRFMVFSMCKCFTNSATNHARRMPRTRVELHLGLENKLPQRTARRAADSIQPTAQEGLH